MSAETTKSSAPAYKVTVGSGQFAQPEKDGLETLIVEDHVDMVDMMTLRATGTEGVPNWNFNIGDAVTASLGAGSKALFKGELTAIEPAFQSESPGTSITLRAYDHLHRLGRGRKTRYWEKSKISAAVEEVASEANLKGVDVDDTGEELPYILQRNESNIAFLKRMAARTNFILNVQDEVLCFKKASFQGACAALALGDNIRSIRMSLNSIDQVQQVVVRGWDIKTKTEIIGTKTISDVTKIGQGQLGGELARKFGDSVAYITDVPVTSQGLANEVALAEMERLARQFCRGTATIHGDETVRAGTMVQFSGLSNELNGKFFVLATRHIISSRTGYSTELTFCSNTFGS